MFSAGTHPLLNQEHEAMPTSQELVRRISACEKTRSTSLDLSPLGLVELPKQVTQFTWLNYLNLVGNSLTTLPLEIGNLTALKTLELNRNPIIELPYSFGNLLELRVLWCAGTKLTRLPEGFKQLRKPTAETAMEGTMCIVR
jgi:Leucine-rich repeat (LRR) protein